MVLAESQPAWIKNPNSVQSENEAGLSKTKNKKNPKTPETPIAATWSATTRPVCVRVGDEGQRASPRSFYMSAAVTHTCGARQVVSAVSLRGDDDDDDGAATVAEELQCTQ